MELAKLFGKNLKRIRESKGYTQQELAELCDMQTNSIGVIEIGQRAVSFSTIEILADKLEANYYDFFEIDCDGDFSKEKLLNDLNREVCTLDDFAIKNTIEHVKSIKKILKMQKPTD